MRPTTVRITRDQVFVVSRVIRNPDNSLVNLTGYVAKLQIDNIRQWSGVEGLAVEVTETPDANGLVTLGGITGTVTGTLYSDTIAGVLLPASKYLWSLWVAPDLGISVPIQVGWGILELGL